MLPHSHPVVLLVSADQRLTGELEHLLPALHLSLTIVADSRHIAAALEAATQSLAEGTQGLLLLDGRLPEVANCRLLAHVSEPAIRRNWALALVASEVSDDWIARLREGIIDDIVPRDSDRPTWKTHLSLIQRGHTLFRELEELREASLQREANPETVQCDPLTGALNRDTLLTTLFRETDRIQRQQGSLSLIGIDLDGLHRFNDEHGREAGDQLLRETARRVSRLLRTYDAFGRIGNDEFLLILPGCSTVNAVMLAERLRNEVFGEPFWVRRAANRSLNPTATKGEVVQIHLSASYAIALSHGRSPVVVIREVEQLLLQASRHQGGVILRSGEWRQNPRNQNHQNEDSGNGTPQLFPETETLATQA